MYNQTTTVKTNQNITLPLPERLYLQFEQMAKATQQSITAVLLHVVEVGAPPSWEDVPAEREELTGLQRKVNRFMPGKAHAAALLRWLGYQLPPVDKL